MNVSLCIKEVYEPEARWEVVRGLFKEHLWYDVVRVRESERGYASKVLII